MDTVIDSNSLVLASLLAALLGLVCGSFVTMASWRWPRQQSWLYPSSSCGSCQKPLRARDLIPVFSWLCNRGQCGCGLQKISVRYPLVEIIMAFIFVVTALRFGLTVDSLVLVPFLTCLMILAVIDWEHHILPDSMNAFIALWGIVWHIYQGHNVLQPILAGVLLFGITYAVAYFASRWLRRDAMGGGDIKFLAAAGIWVGLAGVPMVLILGGFIGGIFGWIWKRYHVHPEQIFPFGPALIAATWLVVLYGDYALSMLPR